MNVLVTGGGSGLGKAITERLAGDAKYIVHFTYNTSAEEANIIENSYKNVTAIKCNFKAPEDIESLCEKIKTLNIQILINNAFTGFEKKHFYKISPQYFVDSFKYNVFPSLLLTKALIANSKKKRYGRIITILSSSIVGNPPTGWSAYVANKNYLLSMSKSWATEYAKYNITSNCISPSFMQTNLNKMVDERVIENIIAKHPYKKLLTPTEVADTVLFLLNASPQINGNNLILNAAESLS